MMENEIPRFEMKALLENYPSIQQILQNIEQAVWVLDLNTAEIVYVSPAFETIWGRPRESLYADPVMLIQSIHPEDRVSVMAANLDENRMSLSQSYRILHPDGSQRWISVHTFLIQEELAGLSYQVWVAEDITGQNQVDQTLRKALDRSREQFTLSRRMSLARGPEAVLKTLMSASELRSAKRAFILFFESPQAGRFHEIEVIASWLSVPNLDNPNDLSNETSLFEDLAILDLFNPSKPVIVTEIAKDQRLTPAVRDTLLEGKILTVAIFPLVALGNWLGCLLVYFPQEKRFEPVEFRHIKVLVDQASITLYNLQLLETEAESRHEAERANEIKTQFLAMISHELRTPLTSIKGFTTTLLADDVTWEPEEQRDFIRTIHQESDRLQELIDHLLDLSRLEAGMLPIVMEPHSFEEIVLDVMPQLKVMTQNHALSLRLPADLPPVLVDAKRIAQVLVNLVHNAVLYTPYGTGIVLAAVTRGQYLQISIIDQGPGIPPGDRKRVFQAFRRGVREENGAGKGAGLGLAICKGLVEAHGGRIWIKKQASMGTTISFTIPLVTSHPSNNTPGKV
jgi:PAS domain S-box-containing protein